MYFSEDQILASLKELERVHPFYGITFFACKQANLPVGESINFKMDSITLSLMKKHHRIDLSSKYFYQPYKSVKKWVRQDYPSSGLQAINTQTFKDAFIHEGHTSIWAWAQDYVSFLADKLKGYAPLPAFHLAVWFYRSFEWPDGTTLKGVVDKLIIDFNVTNEELDELFDLAVPQKLPLADIFQLNKVTRNELLASLDPPPDAKPDEGGTLTYLELFGLGPAKKLLLKPAKRLTLITGDNGLGKSFLIDCAWWALTGTWAERPAYPNLTGEKQKAAISFSIEGEQRKSKIEKIYFDWNNQAWHKIKKRPTIPGLTVYARVDGSFAVWDPAKHFKENYGGGNVPTYFDSSMQMGPSHVKVVFTGDEVWNGLQGRIEGLVRDWVKWQSNPQKHPFKIFTKVLEKLSPPDMGYLEPGEAVRIPGDPRDIPTIKQPYGETPIVYSSAGIKRAISLAYLIVWSWSEHLVSSELSKTAPQNRMVILVDELEAHLHPKWQRTLLSALLTVDEVLSENLEIQFIVATHSPLVMASAEAIFREEIDSLYHLSLDSDGFVDLEEIDFAIWGDISSWLTSPIFELKHARSKEAEAAINDAKSLQLKRKATHKEVLVISNKLKKYLGSDDRFWPRWVSFANKHGVEL
jgi:predicted ATPase